METTSKVDTIQIVDEILTRIRKSMRDHNNGVVVGWKSRNRLLITGCFSTELTNDAHFFDAYLPGGFFLCGTYNDDESLPIVIDPKIFAMHIHFWLAPDDSLRCVLNDETNMTVTVITGEEAVDNFALNSVVFQIRGIVPVKLVVEQNRYDFVHDEVITADSIFKLVEENLYLTFGSAQARLLKDIKEPIRNSKQFSGPKKFSRVFKCHQVTMLSCLSTGRAAVPYIKHDPFKSGCRSIPCSLNALCLVSLSTPLTGLPRLLRTAVTRQLYLLKKVITDHHDVSLYNIPLPRFHYFFVPGWCHPIGVCLPANRDDDSLENYRKEYLHPTFAIPHNRPVFRRVQEEFLFPPTETDDALISPHLNVKDPAKKHGQVVTLTGAYAYYHYNQNNFTDNGWGCAYRSLQTLVSWLRLQGYTQKSTPDHETIQKLTVESGDRPKSFIGSKEWIGAIEVSHVLAAYANVETKIIHVNRGSELNSVGRQLKMHFQTQGTPVMIGGGVFAHTLLGVCFNDKTGDTLFLVLDPHYIGPENIEKITSRGWCGWKNLNFWNQNAFYNLCLPQRPKGV